MWKFPDTKIVRLSVALSNSSPSLKTGLEIGRQGELYLYERKLDAALESYTSALGILVPFVNNEPKGERRNLLLQQVSSCQCFYMTHHLYLWLIPVGVLDQGGWEH